MLVPQQQAQDSIETQRYSPSYLSRTGSEGGLNPTSQGAHNLSDKSETHGH